MTYRLGETFPLQAVYTGPSAVAMNLQITAPDGTITSVTDAQMSVAGPAPTWTYSYPFTPGQVGDYLYVFTGAGFVFDDQIHAISNTLRIVGLAEVKEHGNITSTASDRELLDFIGTAQQMIEELVGPTVPQTITETHYTGTQTLYLEQAPAMSILQVTESGGAVTPSLYNVDLARGTIDRADGRAWYGAAGTPLVVAYRAGRNPIPEAIRWAAKELTIHLWRSTQAQRGGRARGDATEAVAAGFGVPNRVQDALKPFLLGPVVA